MEKDIEYYQAKLKIAQELGNEKEQVAVLADICRCLNEAGESTDAISYGVEALKMIQDLGDREQEQTIHRNLGISYQYIEDYNRARERFMESLKIARERGDKKQESLVYKDLERICKETGQVELSLEYYTEALKIETELSANGTPEVIADKRNITEGVQSLLSSESSSEKNLGLNAEDKQSMATATAIATSTKFGVNTTAIQSLLPNESSTGDNLKLNAEDGQSSATANAVATGTEFGVNTTGRKQRIPRGRVFSAAGKLEGNVDRKQRTRKKRPISAFGKLEGNANRKQRIRKKRPIFAAGKLEGNAGIHVNILARSFDEAENFSTFQTEKLEWRAESQKVLIASDLSDEIYFGLCKKLNSQMSKDDFKRFGEKMGYSMKQVNNFKQKRNPANALLSDWQNKCGNNLEKLMSIYEEMGHHDVVAMLQNAVVDESHGYDNNTSSTPSVHSRNEASEAREIEWKQVSKKHQAKLQRLVELRKTTPSQISRKGIYSMCFQEEFCIGEGSDGTKVYVGLCDDGKEVAVKRLSAGMCKDLAKNEINILISPSVRKEHHVVNYLFYDIDEVSGYVYVILDLCEEDLNGYMGHRHVEELREEGPKIFRDILKGLEALHSGDPKILHRDLRPGNILVNCENEMVLADFGISRSIKKETKTHVSTPTNIQGWVAVESIPTDEDEEDEDQAAEQIQVRYKAQSDIQVTGMLFFYILMGGKHPYGKALHKQMHNISKGNPVNLRKLPDPVAKDLIQWMLNAKPEDRPMAEQCLKHPYLLSKVEQFDLVKSVGNQAEIKTNDPTSPVVQNLNADTSLPKPSWKSWKSAIDADVMKHICAHRSYSDDMADLLRLIRNTAEHWYDKKHPTAIELKVGDPKEYFLKLFPTLPVVLHRTIRNDPHWRQREQLKKFF